MIGTLMQLNNYYRQLSPVSCCISFCFVIMLSLSSNVFASATSAEVDVAAKQNSPLWQAIEKRGANQSVYFHAWGGDAQINNYIQWVGDRVEALYNIDLNHVKLTDTAEAVSRVLAEKSANNHNNGQVDLVWINGANFASMAKNGLLAPNWAEQLPNFVLTNPTNNPAMTRDFGVPTQGMEAPWGQAALTFYFDSLKSKQLYIFIIISKIIFHFLRNFSNDLYFSRILALSWGLKKLNKIIKHDYVHFK